MPSFVLFLVAISATAPAQQQPLPVIRGGAREVMVDLVVRDRQGVPVRDLRPEEVEVEEDGTQQSLTSFRLVEGSRAVARGVEAAKPAAGLVDPLRQINLVTLLFERLGTDARRPSRQAALEFLKNELRPNVYLAVFAIDQRLYVLQPFTNDHDLLQKGVERATGGQYSQFPVQSAEFRQQLQREGLAEPPSPTLGTATPAQAAKFAAATVAQITLGSLEYADAMERAQQGRSSIFGLLALAEEQKRLPGRKTIVYFTEGLQVTTGLADFFRTAISEANRANVSIYAVDARGLQTTGQLSSTQSALDRAAALSRAQARNAGLGPLTPEQMRLAEITQETLYADVQGNLATLAESTGGFLVSNTNDLAGPLHRVIEDINTYYEASYIPSWKDYDGRFHKITVKILRPDVKVQARSGYFAVPSLEGSPLLPYEMPMLVALSSSELPRSFEYHAAALRFDPYPDGAEYALVIEVPLRNITFEVDKQKKACRARLRVLALLRDAQSKVVEKFSQDPSFEAPLEKMETFQRGNFIFTRSVRLRPGRYHLETAVYDSARQNCSARRTVVAVPSAPSGVTISSLCQIRRIDTQAPKEEGKDDPLHAQSGKVIPSLGDPIPREPGSTVSFYIIVYPSKALAEIPQLLIEFFREGKLVARGTPELPPPDKQGRIRYFTSAPAQKFSPGQYDVRVVVKQGPSEAAESGTFTVAQ